MIKKICVHIADCTNPYINLATEKVLLDTVKDDEIILYLWQNDNTVVIGRNQNPWAECNLYAMEKDGALLARRLSGGGAVFHDLGNLNFTFISSTENYSLESNLQVIKKACHIAGIDVEISGRNDILAYGKKFSGNAFYNSKGKSYHHGTIMVNANPRKLDCYLTPSKAKLEAKGVKSVKSRVINLTELNPDLTTEKMKSFCIDAFEKVHGLTATEITNLNSVEITKLSKKYSTWDYLYGTQPPFTFSCDGHFDWGGIEIKLNVEKGIIKEISVYTDSMDWELAPKVKKALTGCTFSKNKMSIELIKHLPADIAENIIELFKDTI